MSISPLHVALAVAASGVLLRATYLMLVVKPQKRRLAEAVKRKQAELQNSISHAKAWLTESGGPLRDTVVVTVTSSTIPQLIDLQRRGELTAVDILRVFVSKAIEAHTRTNCLTWLDVSLASAAAKAADVKRESGCPLGDLHGIPVSIKDCIDIEATDSTAGMASKCFCPAASDAVTVQQIKRAGGIIFCKTNIPQTLLSFECINYVFGKATNPVNPDYSCGGSSGGEGSLIALGGAAVGVGTDIGGSIRIPAHFCGIYGFKPTQWRVSTKGLGGAYRGQEAVPAVVGPMARNLDDLVTLMKVFTSDGSLMDGNVTPIAFRMERFHGIYDPNTRRATRPLKFGYYLSDGFFPASPACRRAVLLAVSALQAEGHTCVLIEPNHLGLDAVALYYRLLGADGGKNLRAVLGHEPIIPHIKGILSLVRLPKIVKRVLAKMIAFKDPVLGHIVSSVRESTVQEYWALQLQRQMLRDQVGQLFRTQGLDAVVAPALVTPAVPHGSSAEAQMGAMYTGLLNLLDMPSAVIPVTRVDTSLDEWKHEAAHDKCPVITARIRTMYRPAPGLPVGIQISATKLNDEIALACAAVVDEALKTSKGR